MRNSWKALEKGANGKEIADKIREIIKKENGDEKARESQGRAIETRVDFRKDITVHVSDRRGDFPLPRWQGCSGMGGRDRPENAIMNRKLSNDNKIYHYNTSTAQGN